MSSRDNALLQSEKIISKAKYWNNFCFIRGTGCLEATACEMGRAGGSSITWHKLGRDCKHPYAVSHVGAQVMSRKQSGD